MKKSLIAAAVAVSLSAPAMAQVSISGFFNASYDQFNVSQTSATRVGRSSENRVTDNSSRILFNVSEDLGGGMRALGQFDLRVAMDAMQPIAPFNTAAGEQVPPVNVINGGNNHVGLQTNMGTFRFGRQDIQYVENALFMPVGLATIASHAGHFHGTGIGTRSITGATRTPNLAWWVSPRWNGMQLTLGYSTNPAANSSFSVQSENDLSKAGNGSRVGSGTWVKLDAAIGNLAVVYSQVDMKPDYTGLAQTVDGGGAVTTAGGGANAQAWTGTAASNVMADEAGKVLTGKYNLGNGWNVGVGLARNKSTVVLTGVSTTNNATQIGVGYTSGAQDRKSVV